MTKPIRVLHLTSVETSNYFLNNLCDSLDRDRVETFVATLGASGAFTQDLQHRCVATYALECQSRSRYPQAVRELCRIIRDSRIDVVHTHLFEPSLLGLLAARRCGVRTVTTRHHSDAVHRITHPLRRRVWLSGERWVNRSAGHIIAPSTMVRQVLVEWEGVPADRVSVIPYGQKLERFESVDQEAAARLRAELGVGERLLLLCVSRLIEQKGHLYLFRALAELTRGGLEALLVLVGTGDFRPQLERAAAELGILDRVRFLGWRNDALTLMAAADVIVHPSMEDALPSAVIEACMLEKPLVVTDVSGVIDILGDAENGRMVPRADADAFRDALDQTVRDLPAARTRAARARQHILGYMDSDRVAREYTACYERSMGRPAAAGG